MKDNRVPLWVFLQPAVVKARLTVCWRLQVWSALVHPPKPRPLGLRAHARAHVRTHTPTCVPANTWRQAHAQTVCTEVWRALSPMVRHLAAAVWFVECSQLEEGGGVLRAKGGGAVYLEKHDTRDRDTWTYCTNYFTLNSSEKLKGKYFISRCLNGMSEKAVHSLTLSQSLFILFLFYIHNLF